MERVKIVKRVLSMHRVKIAITAYEPVLYTEFYPIFEDSPFLIIIDEYNHVQKYSAEIGSKEILKGRAEWIIGRGARILITGSIDNEDYWKLRLAGVTIRWESFGEVKSLVERARIAADHVQETMENRKPIDRSRYSKGLRANSFAAPCFVHIREEDIKYLERLEQKVEKEGKKLLLQIKDEEGSNYDDYETSGDTTSKE